MAKPKETLNSRNVDADFYATSATSVTSVTSITSIDISQQPDEDGFFHIITSNQEGAEKEVKIDYTILSSKRVDDDVYMLVETEDPEDLDATEITFFRGLAQNATNSDIFLQEVTADDDDINFILTLFDEELKEFDINIHEEDGENDEEEDG
ncbi:MAG: hypothetical protein FWG68_04645 [Defluviitaleaceae bacterium]|nr:hypothetical protein [Defluviitaleaceae bacterium]